jgi:hypothetical protein
LEAGAKRVVLTMFDSQEGRVFTGQMEC